MINLSYLASGFPKFRLSVKGKPGIIRKIRPFAHFRVKTDGGTEIVYYLNI